MAEQCTSGFITETTGSADESDCKPCQSGKYCKGDETGPCDEGTICKRAEVRPGGDACEAGTVCSIQTVGEEKVGAVVEIDCPVGTVGGNNECKECPAGSYCPELKTLNPTDCEPGEVCPEGTGYRESTDGCPVGTYMDDSCSINIHETENWRDCCITCPAGAFCSEFVQWVFTAKAKILFELKHLVFPVNSVIK